MPWVRLDDTFADHPKFLSAGPIAQLIQVRALCYAARHLTNGFIPHSILPWLLTGMEHIGIETAGIKGNAGHVIASVGCDVGDMDWPAIMIKEKLWEKVRNGWRIHDYLTYQPSRESVLTKREHTRKRVEEWRNRNAVSNDVGNAVSNSALPPIPSPSQSGSEKEGNKTRGEGESEGGTGDSARHKERAGKRPFPAEFSFTTEMREWANQKNCMDAARQFERFKAFHISKDTRFSNWEMAWRNWALKRVEMKEDRHA